MEYSANSDKITRDYFDSLLLETRYLDSAIPSTKMELFGEVFDTPIMTAALSHLHNTAENGMVVYAEAAKKANAVHWVGMGSDEELEQIIATGAKTIKIIKPHEDNNEVFRKIEHGREAGCFALGMDIDHSFSADGNYDNVMGLKMKSKTTEELAEFVNDFDAAKGNDFETVKDITQTTIKLVYPKYYPEGAVQFFCNHHADDRILNDIVAGKVYLFEADDVCVGTVTISNNEICRLFVLPEYQHKGYGRLLIDYAEKMISKTNKTVVLDASFPAKKIYIKRGYEPTEYNMIETENGDYLCFDVMEESI